MNDFNRIAPIYDGMVQLVFGRKLWEAQQCHLSKIQPKDKVLILGGGVGRILEWLPECGVDYLEKSEVMLAKSRKYGKANFIHADFLTNDFETKYDCIVCPFFLDCFDEIELRFCLDKIQNLLRPNGKVIVTEFQSQRTSHTLLVKVMITFFRITARISAKRLLPFRRLMNHHDFKAIDKKDFLKGLVFSDLYTTLKK